MTEDPRLIRTVDWKSVFPFLHLFRAFRIAIHPSKILLALSFVLLMYGFGRTLDAVWPAAYSYPEARSQVIELPRIYGVSTEVPASGPFDYFLKYELTRLHFITLSVWELDPAGLFESVRDFVFYGPGWGFQRHPVFSMLFGAFFLLAWSIFGGAIARVAAVHVARDEKISIRNALRFSSGKLLSFLFAPVILAVFVGVVGLVISAANLVFWIPYLGPVVVGAAYVLFLLAGFVMTLTLFGALGGGGLTYPTVAVEGSDAFDAISRSFSYFFARPWKLFIYSLTALIYGVVTYLFLKAFIWAMLMLVRTFQLWFLPERVAESFVLFFPEPNFWSLSFEPQYSRMAETPGLALGTGLFSFWYYLLVAFLGSYAISFYFSANTIIYCLLRQDVDATELEEVYLEEMDDDELAESVAVPQNVSGEVAPAPVAREASSSSGGEPTSGNDSRDEQPPTFSSGPPVQ